MRHGTGIHDGNRESPASEFQGGGQSEDTCARNDYGLLSSHKGFHSHFFDKLGTSLTLPQGGGN